jgi:hypothetical protein
MMPEASRAPRRRSRVLRARGSGGQTGCSDLPDYRRRLRQDGDDWLVHVRSVIALGHELGLLVTAEGVEDAASLEWLRTFGCDCAQGYFFARPLDAEAATGWLRALQAARLRSGRAAEPVGRVA